jgi:conjugal transfer ATP-binding protein TraC
VPKLFKKKQKKSFVESAEVPSIAGGQPNVNDIIVSDGAVIEMDHIQIGDRFIRTYHVIQMPSEIGVTWLEGVYQMGDVDVTVHMLPGENHAVIKELTHRITQYEAQLYIERKRGDIYNLSTLEAKAQDAWALRQAIQLNQDKLFYVSIQIMISAGSLDELNRKGRLLEEILGGRATYVRQAFLRQMDGFRSVAPLGNNFMSDVYRNFNLGAAIAMFPFINAELAHPGGTLLGINGFTGAPVLYNAFIGPPTLLNHNISIFGSAGSGKSTFIKLYVERSAISGVRTVIIDPEGEYGSLIKELNGVMVQFENDRPAMINPFDLEEEIEAEGKKSVRLIEKILEMKSLISVMAEGSGTILNPEDLSLIETAIKEDYLSRGITENPESLYEIHTAPDMLGKRKKDMPTLSSIYAKLSDIAPNSRLLVILKPFLQGGTLGIFDGASQVQLKDTPVVCFDVSQLEEKFMRPLAMHVVLQWIWEKFVKKNPHIKKHVIVDEAWRFLKYKDSADFLENMSRRGRKRVAGLITATQGFYEFTESQQGKSILTNSATMILMKQSSTDHNAIQELLHLPQGQVEVLRQFNQGDALLKIGGDAALLRVTVLPFEQEMVQTGVSAIS